MTEDKKNPQSGDTFVLTSIIGEKNKGALSLDAQKRASITDFCLFFIVSIRKRYNALSVALNTAQYCQGKENKYMICHHSTCQPLIKDKKCFPFYSNT